MTPSGDCLALAKKFEGCRLEAYRDSVGVLTIGYGHTGEGVAEGMAWTQEQADAHLEKDMEAAASEVEHLLKVPVSQGQFDALTDFAYNLGAGTLARSRVMSLTNARRFAEAADAILGYDHAAGQVLLGLLRRRQAERDLFLKGL
jgi:lysozyme